MDELMTHGDAVRTGEYGAGLIRAERLRQVSEEHYDAVNDDRHAAGQLASAAMCYAEAARILATGGTLAAVARSAFILRTWPFHRSEWKPHGAAMRNCEKAGALLAAEIDRLARVPGLAAVDGVRVVWNKGEGGDDENGND